MFDYFQILIVLRGAFAVIKFYPELEVKLKKARLYSLAQKKVAQFRWV